MKLLVKHIDQTSLKQYHNSYVLPVFDYGCVIWGNTTHAHVTRLVKLQKRAARIILKADFLTPSEQLLKKLNWLTLPKRVQYHTCLMVFKGTNESVLLHLRSFFINFVCAYHTLARIKVVQLRAVWCYICAYIFTALSWPAASIL